MEKQKQLPRGHKKDLHGNPEGTTYSEVGVASHEVYDDSLLQSKPAQEGIVYNEDGTIFTVPKDADAQIQSMKAEIAGAVVAINKGEQKAATLKEMIAEADAEDKPIFDKKLNSENIAIESNNKAKEAIEKKLAEFRLLLITPAQRGLQREYEGLMAQNDAINIKIAAVKEKLKAFAPALSETKKTNTSSTESSTSTDEQKSNHIALVTKYGSQGKAIVALVKEGWTNTKISKHMGIPPASVPGPKNVFLQSEAGVTWKASDAGKVFETIS